MTEIIKSDNLKLLKTDSDGYKYYVFNPTLLKQFPKSGNMRKMTFLQRGRFFTMKLHGYRVYLIGINDEVYSSIAFSGGGYRFPFANKKDLIYGPSYTIPEYRGQGLAARLGDAVIKEFEKDYENIYATVKLTNEASLRCLEKNGYVKERRIGVNEFTKIYYLDDGGSFWLMKYSRR